MLGTILLLISNIFVKGLGFFYRVMLVRHLGTEGVGLVEMVSPLYSFLLVLAGCGIQPTLSQIIAGRGQERQMAYFHTARKLLLLSGCLVTLLAYLFSPLLISAFIADARAALCFRAVLPAIFIISWASAWRGCFQGQRQVSVIGISQNTEQIVRVLLGLWLVLRFANAGVEKAAAATSLATVGGELAGFLYLVIRMRRNQRQQGYPYAPSLTLSQAASTAREMLSYGIPTTLSRMISSLIMIAEAFMIPVCLQAAGWDVRAATEIYGRFTGVAMTLVHLPGVFTSALSVSVIPAVAESMTLEHSGRQLLKRRVGGSLQAVSICTLPSMALLFILADFLCMRLFSNPPAAVIVRWLSLGGIFLHLQVTLSSVLQGLGEVKCLLINNTVSGLIMLCGVWFLSRRPELGILGAAAAINISWLAGFIFQLISVQRIARIRLPWGNILGLPLVSLLPAMALSLYFLQRCGGQIENWATAITAAALLCGSYLLILLLLNSVHAFDKKEKTKRIVRVRQRF